MRKYLLVLTTLAMLVFSSVAFADTTDVVMAETTAGSSIVDTMTVELLTAQNEAFEKQFAEKQPELYEAFKRNLDTPYGFNLNVNMTANMDYPETEEVDTFNIRRVFAQLYMNGYVNLPKEEMDMKMSISLDAGDMMKQSFDGIILILKDNMMYMFNPMYGEWDVESLTSTDTFEYTGNPMEQNNIGILAPVSDLITKRELSNSTIYSLRMTEEDIKTIVDEYLGMPVYDQLVSEMETAGVAFEIPSIETDYVVQDGVLRVQHSEIEMMITAEGVTVNLNIALDGEYYSYGLQKEIVAPDVETPVME